MPSRYWLKGSVTNMVAKTIGGVLVYFEVTEVDPNFTAYSIKGGYLAYWKMDSVLMIMVSHDGTKFKLKTEERGELEATANAVANLDIYEMKQVY